MKPLPFKLPEIPEVEQTPLIQDLLQIILHLQERIGQLEEEIQRLKGLKGKPKIEPSKLDEEAGQESSADTPRRQPPLKRKKTQQLVIHHTVVIKAESVPQEAVFKGYQNYVVQDLLIRADTTRYRLEQWSLPDGNYVIAEVPEAVRGRHYGPTLVSYILHRYYHQHVTQPLLLEQLWEFGIEISSGQLSRILSEGKELFHQEKEELLVVGKEVSRYLQTDDTGARHQGKNGYCTYIGNELFAWFASTKSKSRVNFLKLLGAGPTHYVVNAGALEYMERQKLPQAKVALLEAKCGVFVTKGEWERHLKGVGVEDERHVQSATEGALVGNLLAQGFPADTAIVSDDAGQFNVFRHALCWIHAERSIHRLIPLNDSHRKALAWIRHQIWNLYADLKTYKATPNEALKARLSADFDAVCITKTDFETLNCALKRLHQNKAELLLVLEKPGLPLHNNLSERDIRDYVKKRKISGSTRSDLGRQCRDTFASLKKTCRKHGISFWDYLKDRVARVNAILPLSDYIRQAAHSRA
jgi:transposase IS66 family protein